LHAYSNSSSKFSTVPIKPTPSQSQFPAENSDFASSSFVNGAKDVDSASDASESTDVAVGTSHDVRVPMGVEIDPIDDPSQYELDLFLQPQSAADFEYWAKVPVWSLDEAIALSFGKNPDQVDWESIEIYRDVSLIAQNFWNCRRLVLRYQAIGRLSDPTYPRDFIEWAHQTETEIPIALVEAVSKRWHQAVDWRQYCYDQKAYYDDQIGKWKSALEALHAERQELADVVDGLTKAIAERDNSISQLRECQHFLEIARGEAESDNYLRPDKPLHTKERESLLKIAIGLAVGGYRYDPAEKRSSVVKEMIDDMADAGISLSVDTLRKFLRAGAEFLPSERGEEPPQTKPKRRRTGASSAR
jgi:hypothetical protein